MEAQPVELTLAELHLSNLLACRLPRQPLSSAVQAAARAWSEKVWRLSADVPAPPMCSSELNLSCRPVFICGAPRSGTTLLRDLLDGHPQLAVVPAESHYFTGLEPMLFGLPASRHVEVLGLEWLEGMIFPPPHWLLGREAGSAAYIRFAAHFRELCRNSTAARIASWPLAAMALAYARERAKQAEIWVEKTPGHERHLPRILQDYPDALILHLVRDPMAVLASWKKLQAHRWNLREAARFSSRILAPSFAVAAATAASARHLVLRYEELVADRSRTMQRVARFLAIEPSPLLCQATVAGREASSNTSFNELRPDPRHVLTEPERIVSMLAAGRSAARLGYSFTSAA